MSKNKYRIPLFYLVTTLYWFALYAYVPYLSPYATSIGASYKMVGLIVGSYGFTQMVLRIPLGIISDTLNKRKIFVIGGVLLGFISSMGMAILPYPGWLLVFRSLAGASAAAWVAYSVLFSSYFEDHEAPKAIGIINSFTSLGQALAMAFGMVAAQFFRQEITFWVASIGGAIGLVASFWVVDKPVENRKPLKVHQLLEVGKDLQLLLVSGLAILSQLVTFGTTYGFTPVVANDLGASNFELGLLTLLSTLPVVFASAFSGSVLVKRWGEGKTIVIGFLISALACIAIPYSGNMLILYITQIIGGFGRGISFPLLMGLSIKTVPGERRATAMGFFQAIYGLGMFMGPVIVGFFGDTIGMVWGFWATGMMSLAGAAITAVITKKASQGVSFS